MLARRGRLRTPRALAAGIAAVALLALISAADRRGLLLAPPHVASSDVNNLVVRVVRVIDGDTIDVARVDATTGEAFTRVRVWGIDCPEMPGPDRAGEPWAAEATAHCRRLLVGQDVRLSIEPGRTRDRYGRLLAHVDRTDGADLAVSLLERGLARAEDRWPHARLRRHAGAERRARRSGIGIWSGESGRMQRGSRNGSLSRVGRGRRAAAFFPRCSWFEGPFGERSYSMGPFTRGGRKTAADCHPREHPRSRYAAAEPTESFGGKGKQHHDHSRIPRA